MRHQHTCNTHHTTEMAKKVHTMGLVQRRLLQELNDLCHLTSLDGEAGSSSEKLLSVYDEMYGDMIRSK